MERLRHNFHMTGKSEASLFQRTGWSRADAAEAVLHESKTCQSQPTEIFDFERDSKLSFCLDRVVLSSVTSKRQQSRPNIFEICTGISLEINSSIQ